MKNRIQSYLSCIRGFIALSALSASSFGNELNKGWFPPAPEVMSFSPRSESADGLKVDFYELRSPSLAANWFPGGGWLIQEGATGVSLAFNQRVNTRFKMELFIYPPSEHVADFQKSSLENYEQSLRTEFGEFKFSPEELNFERPRLAALPLFDRPYRSVRYELARNNADGERLSVLELFAFLENGAIGRLRFSGSENFVALVWEDLSKEVSRFEVIEVNSR